jgi:hypothetical protein
VMLRRIVADASITIGAYTRVERYDLPHFPLRFTPHLLDGIITGEDDEL